MPDRNGYEFQPESKLMSVFFVLFWGGGERTQVESGSYGQTAPLRSEAFSKA